MLKKPTYPLYSWSEGKFSYKIIRTNPLGKTERVARISKRVNGALAITIGMTQALEDNKYSFPW